MKRDCQENNEKTKNRKYYAIFHVETTSASVCFVCILSCQLPRLRNCESPGRVIQGTVWCRLKEIPMTQTLQYIFFSSKHYILVVVEFLRLWKMTLTYLFFFCYSGLSQKRSTQIAQTHTSLLYSYDNDKHYFHMLSKRLRFYHQDELLALVTHIYNPSTLGDGGDRSQVQGQPELPGRPCLRRKH